MSEGLLEVRRGAGTFVRESVLDYVLERLLSFTDKRRAAGRKPATQLIAYRKLAAAEAPLAVAQALTTAPDDARGSLYACWTGKCGLAIASADEIVHAVKATTADAQRLQIPVGAACFRIVATGFVTHQTPLWHEETLYRADAYEFRNRIGGLNGTRAALGRFIGSGPGEECSPGATISSRISPP